MKRPTYDELLEMLGTVSNTADKMLHHHAAQMSADEYRERMRIIERALVLCEMLRPADKVARP